jgi:protease-4
LNRADVEAIIDQGLLTAEDAKKAGFIDEVAYEDQIRQSLGKTLQADVLRVVRDYGQKKVDTDFSGMTGMFKLIELMAGGKTSTRESRQEKIAVIYAVGAIMSGRSQTDLFGSQTLGCDTIIEALQTAESDDTVAGIVLRIDSPGGSALASDLIWRQIQNSKKPIVASMGDIAASGGYYIAMGCDEIVAEPGTLTGSIGVVGGKIALGGLMNKVGVTTDVISRGKNSGIFSTAERFSDSEREAFRKSMEVVYDQFTRKAAEGRGMEVERLKELAGGRVWTGRQAQQKGLVDSLGTLDHAVARVRQLAEIPESEETEMMVLPKPRTFFEQLFEGPEANLNAAKLPHQLLPLLGQHAADVQMAYRLFQEPMLMWLPYRVTIH